jgi:UDP-glucose:(heptosyl)LPS alpha-1,3-glucosyltransferase
VNVKNKPCIAVLSPFVDRHHGTERIIAEWVSRLTSSFEVHLYSQHVAELDLSGITWHRIPKFPGPHLLNYLWWFGANHLWRWWDHHVRNLRYQLVFSPGINCLDADVISVHVVFAEYCRRERAALALRNQSIRYWPRLLHRRLYYELIMALERRVYANHRNRLILIAKKTAQELQKSFGRNDNPAVVYTGLAHDVFNPENRSRLRQNSRKDEGLSEDDFCLLLIGNGWKNKGLPVVLASLQWLKDLPVRLMVVGKDDSSPYEILTREYGVEKSVRFLPPRSDVIYYYSAADAVVGPSLEDTFALPTVEAMACGLPVITSVANGASELIVNGRDGLLLSNAEDAAELAASIRLLCNDKHLRHQLGQNASRAVAHLNWEESSLMISRILEEVLAVKASSPSRQLGQRMEITRPGSPES